MKKVKQPHGGAVNRFEPGESGNPYGRPTRLVSQVLKDLNADGGEAVSPAQVSDVISVLLNYPASIVKKMAEDKDLPILIQRTARRFAGSTDKEWDLVVEKALDRAHGKSKQAFEHMGKGGDAIEFKDISLENRIAALKLLEKPA